MNYLFSSFLISSLLSFTSFGMESPEVSGMVTINKWQDAAPFARKIVVYSNKEPMHAITQCWASYCLSNSELRYGFVEAGMAPERGIVDYLIIQIVATGTQGDNFPVTSWFGKNLAIRFASDEEIVVLYQYIKNKKDAIAASWRDQRNQLKLLEEQSGFEFEKKKIL